MKVPAKKARIVIEDSSSEDEEYEVVPKRSNKRRAPPRSQSQSQSSQSSQAASQSNVNELHRLSCLAVNFILVANCKNIPIKYADVRKIITKECSRKSAVIIAEAGEMIKEIFGYVMVSNEKADGFILVNSLDVSEVFGDTPPPTPLQDHESARLILRTILLTVTLMNGGSVSEGVLKEFLKKFNIDIDDKAHAVLGNINKYIYQDMARQGYVSVAATGPECLAKEFRWGFRAEHEVSKKELIEFVCKAYGNGIRPEMWHDQWRKASDQENTAHWRSISARPSQ